MNNINRSIWTEADIVKVIDQRLLPHQLQIMSLKSTVDVIDAIKTMVVRGAPLIGVTAAFGVLFAFKESENKVDFKNLINKLAGSRPTAVNLQWAVGQQLSLISEDLTKEEQLHQLWQNALSILEEDIRTCYSIGKNGLQIIEAISHIKKGKPVNILTHCNAGWLACVEWGTATAPVYLAHEAGIPVHVWVDETRPRNQGFNLTAWELGQRNIPHTIIVDNAGGHLMQQGLVDVCITGTDRTAANGDVANKIGTYLKALAAHDNNIPFYVALPSSTIDWSINSGKEIIIEERDAAEVKYMQGLLNNKIEQILIAPESSTAANFAFDVTPAKYISGLITDKGICEAASNGLLSLFPQKGTSKKV